MFRRSLMTLATAVMVVHGVPISGLPATEDELSPAALTSVIDPLIARQLSERQIAGAVVVVVHDGRVIYQKGQGVADVDRRRPLSVRTPVRLASISKMFTAIAVLQLVQAGQLSLDGDARDYLGWPPGPRADGRPLTLRALLSHQSGFEYRTGGIISPDGAREPLLPFLKQHWPPRRAETRPTVAYSNFAFTLLAAVVEHTSGERFERYLDRHIFAPLQMRATSAEQPPPVSLADAVSIGYERAAVPATRWSSAEPVVREVGSTGVVASASDIARFMLAMLDDQGTRHATDATAAVSPAIVRLMLSPAVKWPASFVGLGSYSPVAAGANPFVGHDGGSGGFHGTLALLPRERFGAFVFYNSSGISRNLSPEGELLRAVSDRFFPTPRFPTDAAAAPAPEGAYEPTRRADGSLLSLSALLNQVRFRPSGDGGLLLAPAWLPAGGFHLRRVGLGLYRSDSFEVEFDPDAGFASARIGPPVAQFARVPTWKRAGLVVPGVVIAFLVAVVGLVLPPRGRTRQRPAHRAGARPGLVVTRIASACLCVAVAGAVWMALWGSTLVVTDAPIVTGILVAIYVFAWSGVALTPLVVWRTIDAWRRPTMARGALVYQTVLAPAVVVLAAFCILWRIAGVTLRL